MFKWVKNFVQDNITQKPKKIIKFVVEKTCGRFLKKLSQNQIDGALIEGKFILKNPQLDIDKINDLIPILI